MSVFYVVFDTNVLVSALLTKRFDSPTSLLLDYVLEGKLVPLYNEEIIVEYKDVLHREKFKFANERINAVLDLICLGMELGRTPSGESFPDADDAVFYEVALSKEGSYIVTGNQKHFPKSPIVVSPMEMLKIIEIEKA